MMKRLACIFLIIAIFVSGLAFSKVNGQGTTVGGNITSNTEWTVNDSPVILNASVTVLANTILTIDPGVTVNLGNRFLTVSGTLVAMGTSDNMIIFTVPDNQSFNVQIYFSSTSVGWSDATNSGSIIQYATFNKVVLQLTSSVKINNCQFSSSSAQPFIGVSSGSPIISNNKIVFTGVGAGNTYGVSVNYGTPVITNNEFDGGGQLTGINAQASGFTISNNVFSNCWLGIKAETAVTVAIQGNSFLGCHDGIDANVVASLTVKNNLIDSCTRYGINGGGYFDSNTISNNQLGIHNPGAGTTLNNNNIVGNKLNSITASDASIDAQNNWWGIADTATIQSTIYDVHDDPSLGTVTFVPFLTSPSSSAPAIPATTPSITPAPTTNPTPTTQATVTPTPIPTIPPTVAPTQKSETILNDTSDMLNLNLIATVVIAILALVWVVVILGYVAKRSILRYRAKNSQN